MSHDSVANQPVEIPEGMPWLLIERDQTARLLPHRHWQPRPNTKLPAFASRPTVYGAGRAAVPQGGAAGEIALSTYHLCITGKASGVKLHVGYRYKAADTF
ncbi:hypothetical protein EVAR_97721_1 [Eumeta japonica]|uniref:Uncharacterized protein n=1 Tax=Eumeta variegata TaxID=151549 RepID=A0A4C1XWF5_EUMVA|nr:hypothetical protein EVAR_97721_1 [Eumeta japonica]